MKKKILFILLTGICLLGITGCGGNNSDIETIKLTDEKLELTTKFEYDKEDGFKFEKNVTGGKYAEIEFSNEKMNLYFDAYYTKYSKETSKANKGNVSNDTYFKEFKFGDYEGYSYGLDKDRLYLIINLKTVDKEDIELFVAITKINYDKESVVFDIFKLEPIQNFFKSIKIEG